MAPALGKKRCQLLVVAPIVQGSGDGIGDVPGITGKLDSLKNLGIDVIWKSSTHIKN